MTTPTRRRAAALGLALGMALGTALAPAAAGAQRYRVQQWDTPMQGWFEPTLWTSVVAKSDRSYAHFGRTAPEEGVTAHSTEFEYGVTDRFVVSAYADFESARGLPLRYTQARLETRYRFANRFQRLFDPTLYLEYTVPRAGYERSQELEARLILQRDLGDLRLVLNPTVARTFRPADAESEGGGEGEGSGGEYVGSEGAGNRLVGAFAGAVYYRRRHLVQPGVEYYAQVGPLGQVLPRREQRHFVAPTVDLRFIPGLDWNLGLVVGLTGASDRLTVKSIFSYEFPTVRPSAQAQ